MRLAHTVVLGLVAALTLTACPDGRRRLTCDRPIKGFKTEPGHLYWFGEMHGTEESPRFVGDAVCEAARWDRVQLGLEVWQDEQLRINHYLVDGDRAALLAGPFWSNHDGRSSTAMVALLDRIRKIRDGGGRVEVVAYDVRDNADPDKGMAKAVMGARDPGVVFIGLSGNVHSRKTPYKELTPLVGHLLAAKLPVTTYDVSSTGGTMWSCVGADDHEPVCGEHPSHADAEAGKLWSLGKPRDESHDGLYFVGETKASPPVKP